MVLLVSSIHRTGRAVKRSGESVYTTLRRRATPFLGRQFREVVIFDRDALVNQLVKTGVVRFDNVRTGCCPIQVAVHVIIGIPKPRINVTGIVAKSEGAAQNFRA